MLRGQMTNPPVTVADILNKNDKAAKELESTPQGSNESSFRRLDNSFTSIFNSLQDSDRPPTTQVIAAFNEAQKQLGELKTKWMALKNK